MHELLDLDRYPLHQLDSEAGRALVQRCIADLDAVGMFTLEGFMRRDVIDAILPELLQKFESESFTHAREHNIYFDDAIDDLTPHEPGEREHAVGLEVGAAALHQRAPGLAVEPVQRVAVEIEQFVHGDTISRPRRVYKPGLSPRIQTGAPR